jgi:hypothetical protein
LTTAAGLGRLLPEKKYLILIGRRLVILQTLSGRFVVEKKFLVFAGVWDHFPLFCS